VTAIDPSHSRVPRRCPKLIGDDRALWLLGADEGIRFDPRRRAESGRVKWNFGDGVFAKAFALAGDDLWARAEDGRLLRFDAHTGARKGRASSPAGVGNLAVIPGAGVVVGTEDGTLTRIDASSGRARWTTRIADIQVTEHGSGRTARTVAIAGGTVWALTEPGLRGTERLTAVDLATGRTLTATALKDLGAGWLKPIGDDLWYIAPEGSAVVVRP
jgi:outer membrane protein assembly factor BamB